LNIGNPMSEDRSRSKYLLERVESITTEGVKLPGNVLLGNLYQWNDNVQVVKNKPAIKVSET